MTIANFGPLSITELCQAIDVPLLSLYPQLNALEAEGVVQWNRETVQVAEDRCAPNQ